MRACADITFPVPVQYRTGKKTPGERAGAHKDRYVCRAAREKVPVEAYNCTVNGSKSGGGRPHFTHFSLTFRRRLPQRNQKWGGTPSSTPACLARRV